MSDNFLPCCEIGFFALLYPLYSKNSTTNTNNTDLVIHSELFAQHITIVLFLLCSVLYILLFLCLFICSILFTV